MLGVYSLLDKGLFLKNRTTLAKKMLRLALEYVNPIILNVNFC